jgi:hypothetical protein
MQSFLSVMSVIRLGVWEQGAEECLDLRRGVAGGWRELHSLYASPSIVGVIKSWWVGWRSVWHAWVRRMRTGFWSRGLKGADRRGSMRGWEGSVGLHFREMGWEGVDWMYLTRDGGRWRVLWARGKPWVSTEVGRFLDYLFKKGSAPVGWLVGSLCDVKCLKFLMYMAGWICLNYLTAIVRFQFCNWFMTNTGSYHSLRGKIFAEGTNVFCMCSRWV